MNRRPSVQSFLQSLPFHGSPFDWDTFEDFFCDFLNARPVVVLSDGGSKIKGGIIRARPFGRRGDSQRGIDLLAEMEGGEVWDFQCKHVKKWTPGQTRQAIAAYKRGAPRRFLLVTCEVSEECQEIIKTSPGWVLWDGREINRRFRDSIEQSKAAQILYTHFGPGWAEAFFGISGDGPLIGAEAKFERQLRVGPRFHHRHALIGREKLIEQLDDFVADKAARVFILTGRGGLGKSRLLLEWSRGFSRRHRTHTLRFLSDKCADFGPALQVAPKPLALVFDDAHRLDDVRCALFHELPRREQIKLVLSLRPGPIGQVMRELIDAGFDTTEIVTAEPMKPLTQAQQMALVDASLKPQFSRHRHFLRAASRDCPLIAVVGAELINSGSLASGDLLDEKALQDQVFKSLLDDAHPVRERFGEQETNDFLRLLALLGPVKLDAALFAKATPFLGIAQPDHASHLRDALDEVGLLHTTGAGTRVTPDLLSDHLAYTACYDHMGQSRTFAERLLAHFSPGDFPKLVQHLAEAEWRALDEKPGAASVVEPLWQWFRARFEASSFFDRGEQIKEWANIAHLQPRRSLELAELAVSLITAPPPELEQLRGHRWDCHEHSLEWLPRMLAGVAEHHPEYVARCFDLLWQLGRDKPADAHWHRGHPISLIGDVVTYKHWKSLGVFHAALDWLERLLASDEWQRHLHKPGWLLEKLFDPMFATSVEENWSSGRAFHFRSHPLHLENTAPVRERVRAICRKLLATRDPHLASQLIPVLDKGCDIARLNFAASPSDEFIDAWDAERLKTLAVFEEMVTDFTEPLIHFQIRRALMHFLQYGKDTDVARAAFRRVIAAIPDTLDFRIARAVFGNSCDDLVCNIDDANWQDTAKAKWAAFVREVVDAVRRAFPSPDAWLDHFAALDTRWRAFPGFQPNFREILAAIAESKPAEGVAAAELLLADSTHLLAHTFDSLAMAATKEHAATRLRLIRDAAASESEALRAAAVACCAWWRREGALPEETWQILESLAPTAAPLVADRIVNFVWWNDEQGSLRDWHLLAALPFAPHQTDLAGHIAARASELINRNRLEPDAESVSRFLGRYERLVEPEGRNLKHGFAKLAEAFPVEMFLMLWRRNQALKAGDQSLKALPYDFANIRFPRIMDAPEVRALVAEFERRLAAGEELDFDETRLLRSAIQHGSDNPSAWLEAAVQRATTEEQLNKLRELGSVGGADNAALAYPDFARALLARARAIGPDCYDRIFSHLLHVGGGRGSTDHEPDAEWKGLLAAIERLAHQYAADPELGTLFAAMAKGERSWMESERRRESFEVEDE